MEKLSINIQAFAIAAEALGEQFSLEINSPVFPKDILETLKQKFPQHTSMINSCRVAVNFKLTGNESEIKSEDTVALLPPSSGG